MYSARNGRVSRREGLTKHMGTDVAVQRVLTINGATMRVHFAHERCNKTACHGAPPALHGDTPGYHSLVYDIPSVLHSTQ